jgi:hypothetical protein
MATGIEHAFALGKIAAGKMLTPAEKARLRALEDGWSRGGRDGGGAEQKRKAESWKTKAKPTYDQFRGSRVKGDLLWKTQVDLATLIAIEVPEAPKGDELLTAIKRWISEMDRA